MPDNSVLEGLDKRMSAITGKTGVIQKIEEENDWNVGKTLRRFGLEENPKSQDVYSALLEHLGKSEEHLYDFLDGSNGTKFDSFPTLLKRGYEIMKPKRLWVLKKDKFREILEANPPTNILSILGYKSAKELFEKEKLEEIASSLRFMESSEWMHATFDKAYLSLTPDDFEERNAEAILLSGKFLEAGREFVKKKRHNLSHLKELGLIFIIPIEINEPGELMRVFALYLHYLYEVQFYSDLFRGMKDGSDFAKGLTSLLRGDILDSAPPAVDSNSFNWLIVQRYLAKEDEWEKRLFVPHINPEAVHWKRAEEALAKIDSSDLSFSLGVWEDLDWVGGYFSNHKGDEILSFDLIDTIMSLVDKKYTVKYLYHQQEALWNRLFEGYVGDGDKLEELVKDNLLRGYVSLP